MGKDHFCLSHLWLKKAIKKFEDMMFYVHNQTVILGSKIIKLIKALITERRAHFLSLLNAKKR